MISDLDDSRIFEANGSLLLREGSGTAMEVDWHKQQILTGKGKGLDVRKISKANVLNTLIEYNTLIQFNVGIATILLVRNHPWRAGTVGICSRSQLSSCRA